MNQTNEKQLVDPDKTLVEGSTGEWSIFDSGGEEWFTFPAHIAEDLEAALLVKNVIVDAINYGFRVGHEAGYEQAQRNIQGAMGIVSP